MTVKDELITLQGVYGRECTQARESAEAEFCLLGIVNGRLGTGWVISGPEEIRAKLPEMLRALANDIEETGRLQ